MRLCARDGRERRLCEPVGTEGGLFEGRMECESVDGEILGMMGR